VCPNDRTAFNQPAHLLPKNFDTLDNVHCSLASRKFTCPEHKEAFRYFDTKCQRLICADCAVFNHNDHACQSLAAAAISRRSKLRAMVDRSQSHCSSLEAAAAAVATMREEAEAEYQREKAAIKDAFAKVMMWLNLRQMCCSVEEGACGAAAGAGV